MLNQTNFEMWLCTIDLKCNSAPIFTELEPTRNVQFDVWHHFMSNCPDHFKVSLVVLLPWFRNLFEQNQYQSGGGKSEVLKTCSLQLTCIHTGNADLICSAFLYFMPICISDAQAFSFSQSPANWTILKIHHFHWCCLLCLRYFWDTFLTCTVCILISIQLNAKNVTFVTIINEVASVSNCANASSNTNCLVCLPNYLSSYSLNVLIFSLKFWQKL